MFHDFADLFLVVFVGHERGVGGVHYDRILHAERDHKVPHPKVMTSLGTSTGEAFEIQVVNDGTEPVRLSGSLVLQPIAKEAHAAVQRQLQRALPRGATTARLNAYCLEFLRQPPGPGALFRIAPPEMQKQFAAMRGVLDASRRLRDAGVLQPDSEPKAYFHAIRQWAIWTKAQQFTLVRIQQPEEVPPPEKK